MAEAEGGGVGSVGGAGGSCSTKDRSDLPIALDMDCDIVDIEAPAPPVISDDDWDEDDDDGWLLPCFAACMAFVTGFHTAIQGRVVMCGIYLRDRRFWVCKVLDLVRDMDICRSMNPFAWKHACKQACKQACAHGWMDAFLQNMHRCLHHARTHTHTRTHQVIILIMDMAILRGAISMGEEYCTQDDEISEFGWIIWYSVPILS